MNLICKQYNPSFQNKIANLSTINREKKNVTRGLNKGRQGRSPPLKPLSYGGICSKAQNTERKKEQILYSAFSTSKKTATKKKTPKPAHSFLKFL